MTTTKTLRIREHLGFYDMVTLRLSLMARLDQVRTVYGENSAAEHDLRGLAEALGLTFADVTD